MIKNGSILNTQAAKMLFSLSIALFAMALLIFSVSAQQLSVSADESVVALASQDATIVASTAPTGTSPFPNSVLVPQMRLPIIIHTNGVGTSSLPGTSTVPNANRIYYIPILHVNQ